MIKKNDEITIQGLWKIFVPKLWIIAIVSILFAAVAGIVSAFQEDMYTSHGKYMINKLPSDPDVDKIGLNTSEVEAMGIMINNMKEMLDTDNFPLKVMDRLVGTEWEGKLTIADLQSMMTITQIVNKNTCYYFEATSDNPELSYAVAEVAGDLLIEEYERIHNYAITVAKIGDPKLPIAPNSKNVVRNGLIAFAAGMLLTVLVVFIIAKFDVIIRSKEMIEENIDIPILGVIPRLESND